MEKHGQPLPRGTHSNVAVARHPVHPMLVTFPIAFLLGALASDIAFLLLDEPFWARMSLWLLGAGTMMGILAGIAGTIDLLSVAGIRHRAAGWNHFVVAVMLLAVGFINWLLRLPDPAAVILSTGIYLSLLGALLVGVAGWLGGKLVFEHQVGIHDDDDEGDITKADVQ